MEAPPQEAEPAATETKAEVEDAVPPPAAAAGVVLGPRVRKRVVDTEYVQLYDDEMYESDGSLSDGAPYRAGKRRAGGGSTPAQRARRVRRWYSCTTQASRCCRAKKRRCRHASAPRANPSR